ncbi:MAG: hypothetical protein M3R13_06725 [Armatimonadota bacterium]|nr:hypothetical protein [Armatimonadota bacterium]
MKRPSKKEIKEKLDKLKESKPGVPAIDTQPTGRPEPKKPNKNRIRKQGV